MRAVITTRERHPNPRQPPHEKRQQPELFGEALGLWVWIIVRWCKNSLGIATLFDEKLGSLTDRVDAPFIRERARARKRTRKSEVTLPEGTAHSTQRIVRGSSPRKQCFPAPLAIQSSLLLYLGRQGRKFLQRVRSRGKV